MNTLRSISFIGIVLALLFGVSPSVFAATCSQQTSDLGADGRPIYILVDCETQSPIQQSVSIPVNTNTQTPSATTNTVFGGTSSAGGAHSSAPANFGALQQYLSVNQAGTNCGGAPTGGSLSSALSGILGDSGGGGLFGGGGSSLITCISGEGCPSGFSGGAGGALGQIGGSGQIGQILNTILSGGSGNIAQSIISLAGQNAGSILNALGLGGSSGGGALGGAISQVTGGNIGGILGGGLGGVAGGALGGGASVPTRETNKALVEDLVDDADSTRNSVNFLQTKEGCTDGIAYDLAQHAHAQTTAEILKKTNALQIQNPNKFVENVEASFTKDFIDQLDKQNISSEIKNAVKEFILETYENETEFELQAPPISQSESRREGLLRVFLGDSVRNASIRTLGEYYSKRNEITEGALNALEQSYRPQIVCVDEEGNETEGLIDEDCPTSYKIVTPAPVIEDQAERAIASGQDRVAQVDEAGEVANQFMVQLFQQALTNIGGLLSLSDKNLGDGVSYLDQLSGATQTTSIESARDLLIETLTSSIAIEEEYQLILGAMVDDLGISGGIFQDLYQCYNAVANRGGVNGLSRESALDRANLASTTIQITFKPQIENRLGQIADSELVVQELARLLGLAEAVETGEELNAVSDSFDALIEAGLIHTGADISFLANDYDTSSEALAIVNTTAGAELAQCKQY